MKVSREQMSANRTRILNAASTLFRDRGFDAVTVSEVMKAAGLTHGAFYGHFASKDDLIAQTVTHALMPSDIVSGDLQAYLDAYLSPHHRDRAATGCPTASLASALRHQSSGARAAMTNGLRSQINRLADIVSGTDVDEKRRTAIGSWAAMVGAVILARAVDDPGLSEEVLVQTRAWIDRRGEDFR